MARLPFTETAMRAIEGLLTERFGESLEKGETFTVSGADDGPLVEVKFVLAGGSEGARLELEARVDSKAARVTAEGARDLALDALDAQLLEYFEAERGIRFSGVFETRELRGKPLQLRAERTFPNLEAQANALLGDDFDPDA